jgi:hypothetical protein
MRIELNGTAQEVGHLLQRIEGTAELQVSIETNGHFKHAMPVADEPAPKRPPMSMAARKKIAAAQRARWAKAR